MKGKRSNFFLPKNSNGGAALLPLLAPPTPFFNPLPTKKWLTCTPRRLPTVLRLWEGCRVTPLPLTPMSCPTCVSVAQGTKRPLHPLCFTPPFVPATTNLTLPMLPNHSFLHPLPLSSATAAVSAARHHYYTFAFLPTLLGEPQ